MIILDTHVWVNWILLGEPGLTQPITARSIRKEYRLGAMRGLKQSLLNTAARLTGKQVEQRPLFKALDDVNFDIKRAESHFADVT